MGILYVKALHVIFVVSWFAGLLYIIRLFIYQTEAEEKSEVERKAVQSQLKIMSNRLWTIITWPAAILATIFGYWMVIEFNYWSQPWMMVKLMLTTLLWVYHLITHRLYKKLQNDEVTWSSSQLRLWNELATLWMVTIIFVVTLKGGLSWLYGTIGFFGVGLLLMIGFKVYRKIRKD